MRKPHIIILLFLLPFRTAFSQTKIIKGDTAYWFRRNVQFQKAFDLKDFEKSGDEFDFRFSKPGQVIEISKDSANISGIIINYIYHTRGAGRRGTETFSNRIILSSKQAENAYDIIQNSGILELQSGNKIKKWTQGLDGITYIVEHANKIKYLFKTYWTPSAQDSIPESLIILNFVNSLSDTLHLQERYKAFQSDLPKSGCYNSGGTTSFCFVTNALELGYSGATKLPLGFYISYSALYIGKAKVESAVAFQYNFDNNGFFYLNLQAFKWHIFYKESNFSDFIAYSYQNRNLKIDAVNNYFQNHQIMYGVNIQSNVGIGLGLDYLVGDHGKVGAHMYANKSFSKPNISTTITSSIFANQFNYIIGMFKSFDFSYRFPARRITIGIAYNKFLNYRDFYFKVLVLM